MANKPAIKNVQRSVRVDRELDAKILKKFRTGEDMSVKDAYIFALMFAAKGVELTAEDNERIAREKRAAAAKRKGTR